MTPTGAGAAAKPRQLAGPFRLDDDELRALRVSFAERGVAVLGPDALHQPSWRELRVEAERQRQAASWSLIATNQSGEIRQNSLRGHLGPVARMFLSGHAVQHLLQIVTRRRLTPGWSASCYTYYTGPGQHMGEHCDKFDACRIAMLVYLDVFHSPGQPPSAGTQLHVFRGNNSATGLVMRISARPNRLVILNGAEQAHLRPPLAEGEDVVLLAGCFREIA